MLVVKRKIGERIIVRCQGVEIVICLCEIRDGGHSARIGVKAPREVSIHREETQIKVDAGVPQERSE